MFLLQKANLFESTCFVKKNDLKPDTNRTLSILSHNKSQFDLAFLKINDG